MKKLILLLFIFAFFTNVEEVKATHYMGGEITWKCIPTGQANAGKFVFTLKAYRECYTNNGGSAANFGNTLNLTSNSPAGSIPMTRLTGWPKDISPDCNSNPAFSHITCVGMSTGAANMGAVQEHIYRSQPIQLNGVPPATGWRFGWSSCCRNPAANVNGQPAWYLRAIMYPYQNTNTWPCFDNSPEFAEVPRTVICTGYPFTYNHNAFDKELDSLSFAWGQPMTSANAFLTYAFGYTYLNPLPGPTQNPNNVGAVVNPYTGTISFTSYTTGAYVTSTKVTAFKCGIKVAEIWRDMQIVLLSCGTNSPPTVTPPFAAGTSFIDTVYAGEYVSFALNAQDFQFLPNSSPQTMEIHATGSQFGSFVPPSTSPPSQATFSSTSGCLNPPCATLLPAPGPNYPLTGIFGIQTQFGWQTTCDHLATNTGCGNTSNVYNFVMKVMDDYCPAPAINIATVTVVVLPKPTLPSPDIQCLKVLASGDVALEWSVAIDTMNTFNSYRVYTSNAFAGPYTEIDSIFDISIANYTHVGANATNAPVYYKVGIIAGCPGHELESPADTFSTIHLSVINPNNGTAQLNWNATHTPLLITSTGWYHIYREYPAGTWTFLDSTQNLSYIDPITACGDDVGYRIEIQDTAILDTNGVFHSCFSVSNVDNDYFADIIAPQIPVLDSVSINPITNFVEMAWDQSTNGDTEGYVVYMLINGLMSPIDTVWGDSIITYIDQNNNPCNPNGSYNTYAIAAFDSCGNISPFGIEHNTVNLKAVKDICDDKITITWNAYNNYQSGLQGYEIYASENGGPITLLNINIPLDTVFEHVGLTNNATYCYVIRAVSGVGVTSTSCILCETANKPDQPQFAYIRSASVIPGNVNGVDIRIYTDTAGKVSLYRLERSNDGANWTAIATLPPDYTNPNLTYIDPTALVLQKSYYYRAIVIDSCGMEVITSNTARTILLDVRANDSLYNDLNWNAYQGYLGVPLTYEIYRAVDGVWDGAPIITLPSTQTNFKDDVTNYKDQGGIFEYYVAAMEGPGNIFLFADTSRSNSMSALQKPRLYVPSAFNPNSSSSENRVFYPHGVFVNSKDYLFMVYNRWGEKLFETTQINHGWDGTYNGVESPQEVYTYYVRFTSSSGYLFEDRGTVTLIR